MNLQIQNTSIYRDYVVPAISFSAIIQSDFNIEYPFLITGELLCENKIVSLLQPLLETRNEFDIRDITNTEESRHHRENRKNSFRLNLVAELNEQKIDFIENQRLKSVKKSVKFTLRLKVAGMKIPTTDGHENFKQRVTTEELFETTEITQGDWLQMFTPSLGIGEFYLVELVKPSAESSNKIWADLHELLVKNLSQMEEQIKKGDWERTMEVSRRFFENIKIGDKKKEHEKYKNELENRMKELQFDQEGINNLFDGIWKFFDFTSKFAHQKDKNGGAKPIPNAKKEDAYFIYSLSVNLTNLIYEKVKRTDK